MPEYQGTGRKNTGRTDKYSDETPKKDYQDYRQDYSGERKDRKKSKEISDGFSPRQFLGIPGLQAAAQYLKSAAENFNPNDVKGSKVRLDAATRLYELVSKAEPGKVPSTFVDDVKACLARLI